MTRPDFTTPPRARANVSWFGLVTAPTLNRLRRIWAVNPSRVSPRTWRWLTGGS